MVLVVTWSGPLCCFRNWKVSVIDGTMNSNPYFGFCFTTILQSSHQVRLRMCKKKIRCLKWPSQSQDVNTFSWHSWLFALKRRKGSLVRGWGKAAGLRLSYSSLSSPASLPCRCCWLFLVEERDAWKQRVQRTKRRWITCSRRSSKNCHIVQAELLERSPESSHSQDVI